MKRVQVNVIKPLSIKLRLETSGQADECGLAGAVARVPGNDDGAGVRCDVEYDATPLLTEDGCHETHEVVRSVEVHRDFVGVVLGVLEMELRGDVRCQCRPARRLRSHLLGSGHWIRRC